MTQRDALELHLPRQRTAAPEGVDPEPGAGAPASRIPILPRSFVPRNRLYDELEAAAGGAVTLLVAPAGAGKTLGVAGWLHHTGRADLTTWIEVDRSLTAAQLAAVLGRALSDTSEATDLDAAERADPIVLDNAQDLPAATIRYLDQRLNDDPQRICVLLLSRRDLPFTGLVPQMLGQLNVLRGDVLRLSEDEVVRLVADHARTDSAVVAKAIADRSEGWCAAAVLMARAIGASSDKEAAARRFSITGPPALDQVVGEVFAALQPRERHLLLCSTAESSLTAETATHLTADRNAGQILVGLETTGLLVSSHVPPLRDPTGDRVIDPTYTVHPLLREVARRRLQAGGVDVLRARSTVTRAVDLDLARGQHPHALARLTAVGAHADAARLLAAHGSGMALRGQGDLIRSFASAHPEMIQREPDTWMALALDRWIQADVTAARRWIDRMIAHRGPAAGPDALDGSVRLLRARAGLEPLGPAVDRASQVLSQPLHDSSMHALLPLLMVELGACEAWTGDVSSAQLHLSTAATIGRVDNLPAVTARALSQLALVEFGLGREPGAAALANDALSQIARHGLDQSVTEDRAELARELVRLERPLWPAAEDSALHPGWRGDQPTSESEHRMRVVDPVTCMWARIAHARRLLLAGRLLEAERALDAPVTTPPLPPHLTVFVLFERALHAMVAADPVALSNVAGTLTELALPAEANLALALRADMLGDLPEAIERLRTIHRWARTNQPPVGAIADVAHAQLLAAHGSLEEASRVFRRALAATEQRGNAMPFLGWSRHGVTVGSLLEHALARSDVTPWSQQLAETLRGHPEVTQHLRMVTATPRELTGVVDPALAPRLTPRERVVLRELARGSSYADMADDLVISANTIKTHVKSLYQKLGVSRRSEALAVARRQHLL